MADNIHLFLIREEPDFAEIKVFVDADGLPQVIEEPLAKNKRVSVCIKDVFLHPKNIDQTLVLGMKEKTYSQHKPTSLNNDLLLSGDMCVKEVKQLENETEKEKINLPDACTADNNAHNTVAVKEEIPDNVLKVFEEEPSIIDLCKEDSIQRSLKDVKEEPHMTVEPSCDLITLCEVWEDLYAKHETVDEVLGSEEFHQPKATVCCPKTPQRCQEPSQAHTTPFYLQQPVYDSAHDISTLKQYPGKRKGLKVYPGKRNAPTADSRKEPPKYIETETLSLSSHFMSHVVNDPVSRFICGVCRKEFKWNDLMNHIKKHTVEEPSKRNICSNKQIKPDRYVCEKCNEVFQFKKDLIAHRRKQKKEKPLQCKICSTKFSYKHNLEVHLKWIHKVHITEKPYGCETCWAVFQFKKDLIAHKRIHRREKPKKQYICEICRAVFQFKKHLTAHKRIHRRVKPVQCTMCTTHSSSEQALKGRLKKIFLEVR